MGNFLSLASVTAAIGYLLEEVNKDVPGIKITTRPLDALELQNPVNGLNIFLYLVKPSTSLGIIDVTTKDSSGNEETNPVLLLDLHYIITATAAENDDLVAQQILASAMRVLNEHPIISKDIIRKSTRSKEGLEASDLASQIEDVKLNLEPLNAEDLTKIWSRFPSTNFRPSVAYTAAVVMIESKLVPPSGPMKAIGMGPVSQLTSPNIEWIEPRVLEYSPDARLIIAGSNLKAENVAVEFNQSLSVVPQSAQDVSDKRIIVLLPSDIEAGITKVSVVHKLSSLAGSGAANGPAAARKTSLKSNVAPFVLAPRIVSQSAANCKRGTDLVVNFEPPISREKPIYVMLGDGAFLASEAKSSGPQPDPKIRSVKITVPSDFQTGANLLRISIDGAESNLIIDDNPRSKTFGKAIGPYVEIT